MVHVSAKASSFLKIGVVLFCFMCLFFATYMASRYEHAKTETEIQAHKVKALEEKYQELSMIHQELLQTRTVLIQEKEQMVQEINMLQGKNIRPEDWIHTREMKRQIARHLRINNRSLMERPWFPMSKRI